MSNAPYIRNGLVSLLWGAFFIFSVFAFNIYHPGTVKGILDYFLFYIGIYLIVKGLYRILCGLLPNLGAILERPVWGKVHPKEDLPPRQIDMWLVVGVIMLIAAGAIAGRIFVLLVTVDADKDPMNYHAPMMLAVLFGVWGFLLIMSKLSRRYRAWGEKRNSRKI